LGSTRLVTDGTGNVVRCIDYLPFGEEIPSGENGRTGCYESLGNAILPQYPAPPDVASVKFTGKERDAEMGLDYFGARDFSGAQGRWMSPDWSAIPKPVPYASLGDPQSLNLYAYVRNNPLSRVDTDGHFDCSGKNAQGAGCQALANWNAEHGISPTAKSSPFPGVEVKLPNGKYVDDPRSPTGHMMAPAADLSDVAAAGKETKKIFEHLLASDDGSSAIPFLIGSLAATVATGGQYDYQRVGPQSDLVTGGFQQLRQFKAVSNFDVGLFAQQAGLTLSETIGIASTYAKMISTNKDRSGTGGMDPETYHFTVLGYQTGAGGAYGN
jgi:RHS repeat-associated protein